MSVNPIPAACDRILDAMKVLEEELPDNTTVDGAIRYLYGAPMEPFGYGSPIDSVRAEVTALDDALRALGKLLPESPFTATPLAVYNFITGRTAQSSFEDAMGPEEVAGLLGDLTKHTQTLEAILKRVIETNPTEAGPLFEEVEAVDREALVALGPLAAAQNSAQLLPDDAVRVMSASNRRQTVAHELQDLLFSMKRGE